MNFKKLKEKLNLKSESSLKNLSNIERKEILKTELEKPNNLESKFTFNEARQKATISKRQSIIKSINKL